MVKVYMLFWMVLVKILGKVILMSLEGKVSLLLLVMLLVPCLLLRHSSWQQRTWRVSFLDFTIAHEHSLSLLTCSWRCLLVCRPTLNNYVSCPENIEWRIPPLLRLVFNVTGRNQRGNAILQQRALRTVCQRCIQASNLERWLPLHCWWSETSSRWSR